MLLSTKAKYMKKPRVVVIGASGFVGAYFMYLSKPFHKNIISPSHKELDITNHNIIHKFFFESKPRFIINFAAHTNINEAEKERDDKDRLTWLTNFIGVKNFVLACEKINTHFIHISTDAVFPGTKNYPGPYAEDAPPQKNGENINWYGYSKLKAEEEIKRLKNYTIIRISHPFGNPGSQRDLVAKTINDIKKGKGIFVDQLFTPTFIDDLTNTIWAIILKKQSGIFHVGCQGLVSRFEFDQHLVKKINLKKKLIPVSMEEFLKNNAPHTRLGGFLTTATQNILRVKFHTWQEALDKTISRI